jgi:hypothetical protein
MVETGTFPGMASFGKSDMSKPDPKKEEAFQKRLSGLLDLIDEAVEDTKAHEPHVHFLTALALVHEALHGLRRAIEDPDAKEITWAAPWVETQYPVEWDWERGEQIEPSVTEEDLATLKAGAEALERLMVRRVDEETLYVLTKGAALWKKGNRYRYLLPDHEEDRIAVLPEKEREAALDALYKPFPWPELEGFPFVELPGEVDGRPVTVSVEIQFHALVVDEDERRAYYPVVVGLVFEPPEENPSRWDGWDHETAEDLWRDLFKVLDALIHSHWQKTTKRTPEEIAPFLQRGEPGTEGTERPAAGPPRTVGLPFGKTLASARALDIVSSAHRVRLPRKWSTIPRWKDLVQKEVDRIQEEEGDEAFRDLRDITGDPEARGPLLKKRYRGKDKPAEIQLTAEAERNLKRRVGLGLGFIDVDKEGQECLYKLYEVGERGLLEIGLSWQGLAGPLVDEWREEFRRRTAEAQKAEPLLFDDLNEERRDRVDRMMKHVTLWDDGKRVMEMVLGQVGRQGQNPVQIPAEAFRVLLWGKDRAKTGDWPQDWKSRVESILSSLHALTFRYRTYQTESLKGYGGFIGEWDYVGLGRGAHGDGVYILDVQPGFLGCLRAFETGKTRLRSGRAAALYDFGRKLSREEKKALGWAGKGGTEDYYVQFDAGRVFYNAAAGLTPKQENLLHWLERQLTRKKDTARKGNKAAQVRKTEPDAQEYRVYTSAFCPLLPEGRDYFGALEHHTRNPETGRTLAGTESRKARHTAGLLSEMGYILPSGAAHAERRRMVREALENVKAVVVDYLGGVVAGLNGRDWVRLEDFPRLDEKTLYKKLRLLLFVPSDYEAERRRKWEETTGRKATESLQEAERDAWEPAGAVEAPGDRVVTAEDGFQGLPLHTRLYATMKERSLKQKDLAVLFGVSGKTTSLWLRGTEPDETGRKGKPIPAELVPLVVRWIETGEPPTAEELASRKTRRSGMKGK